MKTQANIWSIETTVKIYTSVLVLNLVIREMELEPLAH